MKRKLVHKTARIKNYNKLITDIDFISEVNLFFFKRKIAINHDLFTKAVYLTELYGTFEYVAIEINGKLTCITVLPNKTKKI